jgi:hypothetical protein
LGSKGPLVLVASRPATSRAPERNPTFSIRQIAAALAGHPGDPSVELRLLLLFESEAADREQVQPRGINEPMATAARAESCDDRSLRRLHQVFELGPYAIGMRGRSELLILLQRGVEHRLALLGRQRVSKVLAGPSRLERIAEPFVLG